MALPAGEGGGSPDAMSIRAILKIPRNRVKNEIFTVPPGLDKLLRMLVGVEEELMKRSTHT